MIKRFYILLLAIVASVGMGWALTPQGTDTWDETTKTLTVNSNPGNAAYQDQSEIKHVVISSSVTQIGGYAFGACFYLETVIASEGLETIAEGAFSGCEHLESVTLPSTLQIVDQHAFAGDSNLKSVTITAPALNDDYGYGVYAFEDTHADLKIYVPEESVETYKTKWSDYEAKIVAIGSGSTPAGNSITINESSHGSVVASPTSAEAGETITLTATPDDGYQLKSISGVYVPVSETLNATSETVNGNKFQAQATSRNNNGWRVYNPGTANTLTVSSLNGTTLITKIEFTSTWGGQRKNNMLSVSAGTLSFDGNDPSTTVTINGINATSVTISGSGTNAGQTWCIKSVKVYYEGTEEEELEISDTENANVKTFTMVDSEVTISAEFEAVAPAPATTVVTITEADFPSDGEYSFTKDGVTITSANGIDAMHNLWYPTFTSSVGNFTKIEISAESYELTGTGWSDGTWTGNASSVSTDGDSHVFVFSGSITITCTIEVAAPASVPTLEVGLVLNEMDEFYIGPDTTYIQFNCFSAENYFFGMGTFKFKGDEYDQDVYGMVFEPKNMETSFMKEYYKGKIYDNYGTNCCTTARPTQMTVVSGDGTKANPFVIEPNTKGECIQAAFSTLPQAADGLLFDMTEKTLITAGVVNAGRVQYSLDNGANWSDELPKATDPGTYKVHYRVLGGNSCVLGIDYDENNFVEATIASDPNVVVWDSTFVKKVSTYHSNAGYNFNKNNVKDGITAFFEGTQVFNGFFGDELYFSGPSALLTFTHEAGKIAKAEFYGTKTAASDTEYNGWVWDADNNKLVWEGTPNATISIQGQGSGKLNVKDVTYMIFTLVPPTPEEVIALINAIGTVEYTAECKQKIDLARKTYERLVGEVAKAAVTNYSTLTQAETDFAALQSAAVQNAIDKIAAIPTPVVYTEACGNAIDAARAAYNALLEADMSKIPEASVTKLTEAENTYANLKKSVVVEAKIDNIPFPVEATLATRDSIQNARAAYDALTAAQKALVNNYQKLLDAEEALAGLMPPPSLPEGALSGKFTINKNGDQIMFAKGNLQATTTDLGATWTWGFAANQWDTIGCAGANTKITGNGTVSENGTVDLFGWSTEATYYGINKSTSSDTYTGGVLKDWGENITSAAWRTLTQDEWKYVVQVRINDKNLRGQATVNGMKGYILLPDAWELPTGSSFTPMPNNWTANVYEGDEWTAMENAGAVFLPIAPRRSGVKVQMQTTGSYWTATKFGSSDSGSSAWMFQILEDFAKTDMSSRYYGYPVRLTMPAVNTNPFDSAQAVKELIEAIPVPVTLNDSSAIYAAREAFDALSDWAKNAIDAATVQKLTDAETALNTLLVQGVIDMINALPNPMTEATTKLSVYTQASEVRAAYNALTPAQQDVIPAEILKKLTDVEAVFNAIAGGGSGETVIKWDKNTGIETVPKGTTSPAYEGMTVTTKKGSKFTGQNSPDQLTFVFSGGLGGFAFANVDGYHITKVVIESTGAMEEALSDPASFGTGWVLSNENKTATWTGDADTVKLWDDVAALAFWNVDYIQFTIASASNPIMDAFAAVDLINLIPDPVTLEDACVNAIKDARAAVDSLYENKSLIDDPDMLKLTNAEAALKDLNQAEADKVITKINNIPLPVELKLATRDSIQNARAAYDALNAEQKPLVSNYDDLVAAEAALAALNPGGGMPAGALSGKFSINAGGDQVSFAKGNLQATTTDLGETWTWGFAANQWDNIWINVANNKINGNGTVSENGTVDLFCWSTSGTYYGINNSGFSAKDVYQGDFVDWSTNMGAGWRTLTKDEWNYLIDNCTKGRAAVNGKNGYIFLPDEWSGPAFTANPDDFTTNTYDGDDWTAMENAGAVFLPYGPARNGTSVLIANDVKYWSSTSVDDDNSYVFTFYTNQSQSDCTSTRRYYGCMVRLVTEGGSLSPLDSAQIVKDLIDAIPQPVVYTEPCGDAITAARAGYDALSDAAKATLDAATVQKLIDAENQYAALEVVAYINLIPEEIVYDPAIKATIENAREKYDALTADQKPLVTNYQKLTDAEAAWAAIAEKVEHNVSYMGKDGELKNEKVALLHIPDPAPDFNGYEFVRWDVKAGDFLEEGLRIKAVYTPIITTNPQGFDTLAYNGLAQELVKAGVAKEGHIEYRIGQGEWSTEVPTATNAGAYVVYYKLVREGHEDYLADSIVASIAKVPVVYTAPTAVESLVYTASNQTLIAAGQTQDGTFEYSFNPTLLDSWNTELLQAMAAGTYNVYYRVQGDLNHLDSTAVDPIAVTIAKAELTATADDKNVIYGDAVPAYTVTYAGWQGDDDATVLTGDIAFVCEYASTSNVGEYTITPSGVDAANYTITFVNGKVTVAKATLMITAEDKNVTYGDAVPEYTATYSGWKNTDDASVVSGLVYTCEYAPTSNVGEYTIVPSGATATNYAISYTNGKVTVAKAALMITAEDKNVTYGDAVPEYTATYSGWKNTDDASVVSGLIYTCEYAPTSNVGEYTIVPSGATATNYAISYTNGKVTVAKAALMITAEDKNVTYGDAVPEYTATYSGWKNTDDASVVSGLIYTCEYAPTSNVGEYTIVPSGATATNYEISFTNGKVTVAQATLTVTAENKSVEYGEVAPAFTASYSGWKNTDDESVVSGLTLTSEYLVTSNVGTYDIVPANATATNYTFVYVNGTLTVNKAALMITADDKSVEYGEVAPAFTASYSGWKNSDDESVVSGLTLTSEYLVTSNVGTYDIVPANATATNYAISYTNGKLTVNKAPLMITADDKNVIYGEVAPAFTASYSGWKNTDDASVVSGLTLTSEYLVTSNVGTYDIVPANASATNYAISYTNGTLTVAKAALTITANDKNVIYGDEHPEFTVTYAGWKNTDDESVVSGLQFSTPYAPGSYIGTYAINPNSATALNYAITFVDGTLTVNKAHVYVSDAEAQIAKFADGHANAVVLEQGVLNGIKLNDPIAHVTTAAFSSADVAEHLTITLFYELTGDAALLNNYNLDPTSDIFTNEGVIIEPFIPDNEEKPEDKEATVNEGIEIYAYGYCDGSGYSLKYHLESGNPDQYKIDFADSRFIDVDWTNLTTVGKDGTIDIDIPVDLPTGDYTMTVYFRDSRFDWLESRQFNVTFHVNLPETYVRPLFDNVIALVDTCNCLTDIQWYWRANSTDLWQPIEGANGYYYHVDGKLTGEYFVSAKMNGEPTYTCGQTDMETLYGETQKAKIIVRAYPNPVVNNTTVTIEYNGSFPEGDKNSAEWNHNIRIVNLMGAEVMNTTFEGNETSVEMGNYPQGNYMISVDGIVVKVMKK